MRRAGRELGMHLTDQELGPYLDAVRVQLAAFYAFYEDAQTFCSPQGHEDRTLPRAWWAPQRPDVGGHVWLCRTDIEPTGEGELSGLTVGLKDHIPVRGLPLTYGSHLMEDFVCDADVPLVTVLLEAGARIVGKLNMDDFSCGGLGWGGIGDFGRVENPRSSDHLSGGSSSGAAAAVALEMCDLAIGGDQGGSVRIPASWCGVVGMKPTSGFVSHTGIIGSDPLLDAVGPLSRDVRTALAFLEAATGCDGRDPRWDPTREPREESRWSNDLSGLRIGVLDEGFAEPIEACVSETVLEALEVLKGCGARLMRVSAPAHEQALAPYQILSVMGSRLLRDSHFTLAGARGFYSEALIASLERRTAWEADWLPPLLKGRYLTASFAQQSLKVGGYARAQNARPWFQREYDRVLAEVDVLAMPTTVCRAPLYEPADTHEDELRRTLGLLKLGRYNPVTNTAPFNYTGHPALSIPCGAAETLPISLQLVGSRFSDFELCQIGMLYEQATQ